MDNQSPAQGAIEATTPAAYTTDTFAQRLRGLLQERGVSGAELSRQLGCSQQAVSKWLRGGRIDEARLHVLAEFLQVDWLWLHHGDAVVKGRARVNPASTLETLRTETFQRLVLAEERLSMAVDGAILGTWEWHLASNAVILSERMAALLDLGAHPCTVSMKQFLAAIHVGDVAALNSTLEDAARHGGHFQLDIRVVTQDRTQRWIFFAGRFQTDRLGHATRGLGIAKDISGRKRVEENLRRERGAYRRLFENTPSLLAVIDSHGHIERCNRRFQSLLGYEAAEVTGREFCEFLTANSENRPSYQDFDFAAGRYPPTIASDMYAKNGQLVHIDWYLGPLSKGRHHLATGHSRQS